MKTLVGYRKFDSKKGTPCAQCFLEISPDTSCVGTSIETLMLFNDACKTVTPDLIGCPVEVIVTYERGVFKTDGIRLGG